MISKRLCIVVIAALMSVTSVGRAEIVVPTNSVWRYLDNGTDQGTSWRLASYNDSSWSNGLAPLGYGDAGMATTPGYGPEPTNKFITYYFRFPWVETNAATLQSILFSSQIDDGAAVYVNNTEVGRYFMTNTVINYLTLATNSPPETNWVDMAVSPGLIVNGTNWIAAEVHQSTPGSSDMRWNFTATVTRSAATGGVPTIANGTLIPPNSTWAYLDGGIAPPTNWNSQSYSDSSWSNGMASLGYGSPAPDTVIGYGSDGNNKHMTAHFRYDFVVPNPTNIGSITLDCQVDDGAVLYLNGVEFLRTNMPAGTVDYTTPANIQVGTATGWFTIAVAPQLLVSGVNTLAAEVHQIGPTSSDTRWNCQGSYTTNITVTGGVITVGLGAGDGRQFWPSTRRTELIISEIMYNGPAGHGDNLDFVELYNTEAVSRDISGFQLTGDIDYTFPQGASIPARSFKVIAANPAYLHAFHQTNGFLGPYSNSLSGGGGQVGLRTRSGGVIQRVSYGNSTPWPEAANGAGHSLVLARPDFGEGSPDAWSASATVYGNPGRENPSVTNYPLLRVKINEFLAHTDPPLEDFVELYNATNTSVDISGCWLTDDPSVAKYQIPPGTTLAGRGFVAFTGTQLGFNLSAGGDRLILLNPGKDVVLDAISFGAQENGQSAGRSPDGSDSFHQLNSRTQAASNSVLKIRDVVINEIMFNPISGDTDDEYVELYNKGGVSTNIGYWRFTDGIDFMFPAGTMLPAGGYAVVTKNKTRFLARYTNLSASVVYEAFGGSLSDGGERLTLSKPDDAALPYQDFVTVDEVSYDDSWGVWVDGEGSSLELKDADSDNRMAMNWAGSDESAKSAWASYDYTTVANFGAFTGDANLLDYYSIQRGIQALLLGAGECLIDNIEVARNGGANIFQYGTFESDLNGWESSYPRGTHARSRRETAQGYGSTGSLRLVAEAGGNNCVDNMACYNSFGGQTISSNDTITVRAKARWLAGTRAFLIHVQGNSAELSGILPVPENLGTPGAQNSRRESNSGPAIQCMTHHPILPVASQGAVVSARIHDPDGISAVSLRYRVDPSYTTNSVAMLDNGTGGDVLSGDGIYSATLPGQSANTLAGFRIQATDGLSVVTTLPATNEADALIQFGQTAVGGSFTSFRFWMDNATHTGFGSRFTHDNDPAAATIVYGDRRVVYNGGVRYRGSAWARAGQWVGSWPTGYWVGIDPMTNSDLSMVFRLPGNDEIMDTDVFSFDLGYSFDPTMQRQNIACWMAESVGIPVMERRYVHLFANQYDKGMKYDEQVPNRDYLDQWYPGDDDGNFYGMDGWYEFGRAGDKWPQFRGDTRRVLDTNGEHKKEAYRWRWEKKLAHPADDDHSTVYDVIDALYTTSDTNHEAIVEGILDVDSWLEYLAVKHTVGDWDSFGYRGGGNGYMYVPNNGKSDLILWDFENCLGHGAQGGYDESVYDMNSDGADMIGILSNQLFTVTDFNRRYWAIYQDMVDGPLAAQNVDPILDAQYNAFVANGITAHSPSTDFTNQWGAVGKDLKDWIATRRSYLAGQMVSYTNAAWSLSQSSISVSARPFTVSGSAPVRVKNLRVNGEAVNVRWTGMTSWQIDLGATNTVNQYSITGWDRQGNQVGGTLLQTVNYSGSLTPPDGNVIISEIMYNAAESGGDYVELYNKSGSTFDLTGCRINGLDFVFPAGSFIGAGQHKVVAQDEDRFLVIYGLSKASVLGGSFGGDLDDGGETLTLERPVVSGGITNWTVVDVVTYDDEAAWPREADGAGYSLQLLDSAEDNNRVGNWGVARKWEYVTFTGTASSDHLYMYMNGPGSVWLDELSIVAGASAGVGFNYIRNGSFDNTVLTPWTVAESHVNSICRSGGARKGTMGLQAIATRAGSSAENSIEQDTVDMTNGAQHTMAFWFLPNPTGSSFTIRLSGSGLITNKNIQNVSGATPGATNVGAQDLAAFADLWINEIMPSNATYMADGNGDFDPWVELYNHSGSSIDLNAGQYYLTDDFDNLTKWAFPSGQTISASTRKMFWLDGETGEGGTHASFRINSQTGGVALVRMQNGAPIVIDYLVYNNVGKNRSYGSHPETSAIDRQIFDLPTGGTSNNPASTLPMVRINEWMAQNSETIADSGDSDFDDWFELYNGSTQTVDLSGWSLTDLATNTNKFTIPGGTTLAAKGYLMVWADNEASQNTSGGALHVNFKLGGSGGYIGLNAPDGVNVDAVIYSNQVDDVSEGSYPDGSDEWFEMAIPTPTTTNRMFQGTAVSMTNGSLRLDWNTRPGSQYRLVYSSSLTSTNWTQVGADTNVSSSTASMVVPADLSRKFFKLIRQ